MMELDHRTTGTPKPSGKKCDFWKYGKAKRGDHHESTRQNGRFFNFLGD